MDAGLNILENLRISIGESVDKLKRSLDESKVNYSIPYSNNKNGKESLIMYIETYGVELNTIDGMVTFIKSSNSELNYVCQSMEKPLDTLLNIKSHLASNFDVDDAEIRIDRFETGSFKSIMSIPFQNKYKVKITSILGIKNGIYIETMELVAI